MKVYKITIAAMAVVIILLLTCNRQKPLPQLSGEVQIQYLSDSVKWKAIIASKDSAIAAAKEKVKISRPNVAKAHVKVQYAIDTAKATYYQYTPEEWENKIAGIQQAANEADSACNALIVDLDGVINSQAIKMEAQMKLEASIRKSYNDLNAASAATIKGLTKQAKKARRTTGLYKAAAAVAVGFALYKSL